MWKHVPIVIKIQFRANIYGFLIIAEIKTCENMSQYQNTSEQTIGFLIAEIYRIFVISGNRINGKLWGDDIISSLVSIFTSTVTVQEMFREILRKFKMSYLPYFVIRFIHQSFTLRLMFEMFYSFFWINLILDRSFPFKCRSLLWSITGQRSCLLSLRDFWLLQTVDKPSPTLSLGRVHKS